MTIKAMGFVCLKRFLFSRPSGCGNDVNVEAGNEFKGGGDRQRP